MAMEIATLQREAASKPNSNPNLVPNSNSNSNSNPFLSTNCKPKPNPDPNSNCNYSFTATLPLNLTATRTLNLSPQLEMRDLSIRSLREQMPSLEMAYPPDGMAHHRLCPSALSLPPLRHPQACFVVQTITLNLAQPCHDFGNAKRCSISITLFIPVLNRRFFRLDCLANPFWGTCSTCLMQPTGIICGRRMHTRPMTH